MSPRPTRAVDRSVAAGGPALAAAGVNVLFRFAIQWLGAAREAAAPLLSCILLGDTADRVVQRAPVPVTVVR